MKSFFKVLILVACGLFLLPMIVFAQDTTLPQVIDLGGGYTISLPLAWTLLRGGGIVTARGSGITLKIFTPTYIDSLNTEISAQTNVVDALVTLYALPPTTEDISKTDVLKSRYSNRLAGVYTDTTDTTTDQMAVVLTMPSGSPGYLIFSADKGELVSQQDIIDPIITSFTGAGGIPSAEATPVHHGVSLGTTDASNSSTSTGDASGVTCTVSTDTANTAQLRVGPGTNRGSISFLPVNTEVTVTGRIVLKDDSVWYQLDKAEAAPKGTSAAELWVADEQVTTTGDCANVGDTSAPPVIPGHVAPPTAVPGNTTPPDQGSADSTPGSLPRAGSWNMTLNATTNASCTGYENVPIPSTEVYDSLTYTFTMFVINNDSFNYGGDVFTRVPGTSSFNGSFTFDDGTNAQIRFDLTSATSMFGQAVTNFSLDDGTPCSSTALFLTSHR